MIRVRFENHLTRITTAGASTAGGGSTNGSSTTAMNTSTTLPLPTTRPAPPGTITTDTPFTVSFVDALVAGALSVRADLSHFLMSE